MSDAAQTITDRIAELGDWRGETLAWVRQLIHDADPDIAVVVARTSTYEIKVQIVDTQAPLYFSKLFLSTMSITREAFAQYVLPVPMGSPHNYFGTANMISGDPEGFWAAVNGWCAPKEQGDPFATRYMGNWPSTGIACPGGVDNPDYSASPKYAYDYIVDLPSGRTQPIVLHIYEPASRGLSPETSGATIDTQFLLRSPDSTPFDDSDNPTTTCSGSGESNPRTYASGSTDNDATIFGQSGWSQYCTIPTSAPAGRYLLSVRTLEGQANSHLFNAFSLVASNNGSGVACDRRSTASCPGVYAKEWMSIMANAGRSFDEKPGLNSSSLATRWQSTLRAVRSRRTIGVFPIRASRSSATSIGGPVSVRGWTSTPLMGSAPSA